MEKEQRNRIYLSLNRIKTLLECSKRYKSVAILVGDIKSRKRVDFDSPTNRRIASYCEMYISFGWCRRYKDDIWQYEAFLKAIRSVKKKMKGILREIIRGVPGLKMFMTMHSVFDISDNKKGNWLSEFMIEELFPTDKEVREAHKEDAVPKKVLDILAIFDPKPPGYEKRYDGLRIEYREWVEHSQKYVADLKLIDLFWEDIGTEFKKINSVKSFIKKQKLVKAG